VKYQWKFKQENMKIIISGYSFQS